MTLETVRTKSDPLFVPGERWGWEFVFDGPPRPSPELDHEPKWQEPAPIDPYWTHQHGEQAKIRSKPFLRWGVIAVVVGLFLSDLSPDLGLLLILSGVASVCWSAQIKRRARFEAERYSREWNDYRLELYRAFEREHESWRERIARHDEAERKRCFEDDLWYPVRPRSTDGRVDVYGGTPFGWASLVTTLGSTLLAQGSAVTILDLSGHQVWAPLAGLSATRGYAARYVQLPEELPMVDVLRGLDDESIVEVIAAAAHDADDSKREDREAKAIDSDLMANVAKAVGSPTSVGRLAAGLRYVLGQYDPRKEDLLGGQEMSRLSDELDYLSNAERLRDRARLLRGLLELVSEMGTTGDHDAASLPDEPGLSVIDLPSRHRRRSAFVTGLMFHALLAKMEGRHRAGPPQVLILVGTDDFGLRSLEHLPRAAARGEVRVIRLFEHLRDDALRVLGGSGASDVFMRLGNEQEATAAAGFIGRSHSYKLSQVTRTVGTSTTKSDGVNFGVQAGETVTTSVSSTGPAGWFDWGGSRIDRLRGGNWHPGLTETVSDSISYPRSTSWSTTRSLAEAVSAQDGMTLARVYEFALEPTEIQSLAPTALFLVEHSAAGRRVVLADCNPGILLLDRVSATPRDELDPG